ncbi:MAG TPA: queuosine salvage family protein [Thermoleophilaceae bacterium]|nr:queuosine salvage family protein [Thermoleophilaceae bacterium]
MPLTDQVRETCRAIAESAEFVSIDVDRLGELEPGPTPDPDFVEGTPADVADFVLTLDSINFGSGWFPTLRKRPGLSGYLTVAAALTDHWRAAGPWSTSDLRALSGADVAAVLGQEPAHELMGLYAEALRDLGRFLGARRALDLVADAEGSAERFASMLAAGMPFYDDRGFWKRAQIAANDLALAGVAEFSDLDRLTIFADNLVPHVLRVDGVLRYDPALAARIDAGELLPRGQEEREIRGCSVHACELIAERLGIPPRSLDSALWNKGQGPRYKSVPRHRTRTVFY